MYPLLVIVAMVVVIAASSARRLGLVQKRIPLLGWLLLLVATAAPLATAWVTLNPGEAYDSATIEGAGKPVKLEVPPQSALLVTAEMPPIAEDAAVTWEDQTLRYELQISGDGWGQKAEGLFFQMTKKGTKFSTQGSPGIQGSGGFTLFGKGKDDQERFLLQGSGTLTVTADTWEGKGAKSMTLAVIPAPPPRAWFWGLILLVGALALYSDFKLGTDHLATDMGFLLGPCFFIVTDVTPQGTLREAIFAMSAGMLLGAIALAGTGWVLEKLLPKPAVKDTAEASKDGAAGTPEPLPPKEPVVEPPKPPRRTGAKGRRASDMPRKED
jgi:hypothetical protein